MASEVCIDDLFSAVSRGDINQLKDLVELGHDIHYKGAEGRSLLHTAAAAGHVQMFAYLIFLGLNPLVLDDHGRTTLHSSCRGGVLDMVQFLCKHYPELVRKVDTKQWTSLHHCAYFTDNKEMFQFLVEQGLHVSTLTKFQDTVLYLACFGGRYEMMKYLIETYPDLKDKANSYGWTVLHAAAYNGNVEVFKFLAEQELDTNCLTKTGRTVLHKACEHCTYDMVKYLTETYPDMTAKVDMYKLTALHHTAWAGNVEVFKFLVEKGMSVYDLDKAKRTVLHLASLNNRYEMVQYLVSTYPDLMQMRTNVGETALLTAASKKNDKIIQYLIDKGMDPSDSINKLNRFLRFFAPVVRYLKSFLRLKPSSATKVDQSIKDTVGASVSNTTQDDDGECDESQPNYNKESLLRVPSVSSEADSGRYSYLGSHSPSSIGSLEECTFYIGIEDESDLAQDTWPPEVTFLSPSLVRTHIKEKGNQSKEIHRLLHWICSRIESSIEGVQFVWPGYTKEDKNEPVFVTMMKETMEVVERPFETFQLLSRKTGEVSNEAKDIIETERQNQLHFTEEESCMLHKCLTKHSSNLMKKHSNLEILSASKIKSMNYGRDNATRKEVTCIVFYVHIKGVIPFDEEPFPTELDGFPTDVREGLFYPYSNPCEYHQNLMMGCQIGTAYGTCGTLGAFVELPNGNVGCLTCWHVFLTDESKSDYKQDTISHRHFRKDVYQPYIPENDFKFGQLFDAILEEGDEYIIGVDAALLEITQPQRLPQNGHFPEATSRTAGFSADKPMVFNSGNVIKSFQEVPKTCNVVKYGCKTGHTIGKLRLSGPAVQKQKFAYQVSTNLQDITELHQQFEVDHIQDQPFSDFGDSGSLVFLVKDDGDDYDIAALGLLVGGTSHNTTIVTPIWAVLEKFGLPLRLWPFSATAPNPQTPTNPGEVLRLGALELDVTTVKTGMDTLNSDINFMKSDIGVMKTDVATLHEDMTSMKSDVSSMKTDVASVKSDLNSLKTDVTSVKSDVATIKTDVTTEIGQNIHAMGQAMQYHMAEISNQLAESMKTLFQDNMEILLQNTSRDKTPTDRATATDSDSDEL